MSDASKGGEKERVKWLPPKDEVDVRTRHSYFIFKIKRGWVGGLNEYRLKKSNLFIFMNSTVHFSNVMIRQYNKYRAHFLI